MHYKKGVNGEVAELAAAPGQQVGLDETLAVVTPDKGYPAAERSSIWPVLARAEPALARKQVRAALI
jgi:hypothetical protein